jgi:hypothetical protein
MIIMDEALMCRRMRHFVPAASARTEHIAPFVRPASAFRPGRRRSLDGRRTLPDGVHRCCASDQGTAMKPSVFPAPST